MGLNPKPRAQNPGMRAPQYKTPEVAARCGGLTRVNVYKDRITLAKPGGLPALPHAASLAAALAPVHRQLAALGRERHRPLHDVSAEQAALADNFLQVGFSMVGRGSSQLYAYGLGRALLNVSAEQAALAENFLQVMELE